MIVAMQESATEEQIQQVIEHLVKMGFEVHRSTGVRQTVLGAVGARVDFDIRELELLNGQREHFKPGRTDETANVDDEVAA